MKRFVMHPAIVAIVFVCGLSIGSVTSVALADQPHMQNALVSLQSALAQLNAASNNKGGHKANAINYVTSAIHEVKLGMIAGSQ
jgi:hypothetical protein